MSAISLISNSAAPGSARADAFGAFAYAGDSLHDRPIGGAPGLSVRARSEALANDPALREAYAAYADRLDRNSRIESFDGNHLSLAGAALFTAALASELD